MHTKIDQFLKKLKRARDCLIHCFVLEDLQYGHLKMLKYFDYSEGSTC